MGLEVVFTHQAKEEYDQIIEYLEIKWGQKFQFLQIAAVLIPST